MTFISRNKADISDDDFYIDWHGTYFRIDILEFIDTFEWDGDLVTMVRGIAKNSSFEFALKYTDYIERLRELEQLGKRIAGLPKQINIAA